MLYLKKKLIYVQRVSSFLQMASQPRSYSKLYRFSGCVLFSVIGILGRIFNIYVQKEKKIIIMENQ